MKERIKKTPFIGYIARKIYRILSIMKKPFPGSEDYWIQRYLLGGNSGSGSYSQLAEFKAKIINDFVKKNNITEIIEYGSGDGNQLKLAEYPSYIGFDVSSNAIKLCEDTFQDDITKSFKLISEYNGETAQLTLSLDVLYHLIEDDIFYSYMERLFDSSEQFVIIYSSDYDEAQNHHVKQRKFTKWIETNISHWKLAQYIPNEFPYKGNNEEGSLSDFYIYKKD
jgi:hypothetical protein